MMLCGPANQNHHLLFPCVHNKLRKCADQIIWRGQEMKRGHWREIQVEKKQMLGWRTVNSFSWVGMGRDNSRFQREKMIVQITFVHKEKRRGKKASFLAQSWKSPILCSVWKQFGQQCKHTMGRRKTQNCSWFHSPKGWIFDVQFS